MEPTKFDPISHTLTDDIKSKLKEVVPEAFTENTINFERLKALLGEAVDAGQERYSFTWPGKTQAIRAAQTPSIGTLVPDKDASLDWDTTKNLYLEGDNLEILKLLQKSYTGKVKIIYIDPPYNTGKDFVYPDNYGEGLKTYLEYTGQVDGEGKKITTNMETDGRYHSKWLNMMYPRLMLARNLLKDDGVIFISIDDHEQANLKKICDEVFGAENFVECFSRVKTETPSNLSEKTKEVIEYVLCYQKSNALKKLSGISKVAQSSNPLLNQSNQSKVLIFPANVVFTNLKDQELDPGEYGTAAYKVILLEKAIIKKGKFVSHVKLQAKFRWSQKYLEDEISKGTIVSIPTKNLIPSYERSDYGREVPPNLIDYKVGADTNEQASSELEELMGNKYFDYPKPASLIKYLISSCDDKEAIVFDFFSGSGTTAHAVIELNAQDGGNRKFIVTQLQEPTPEDSEARRARYQNIAELGRERIKRAGAKIKAENAEKLAERETPLDTGFRTYRLSSSTFNTWEVTSDDDIQAKLLESTSLVKSDAPDEDVLAELILKSGYGLSSLVMTIEIAGVIAHSVENGELLIVLSGTVSQDAVRTIVEANPKRFIARESVFGGDADLTNAAQIMKDKGIDFRVL